MSCGGSALARSVNVSDSSPASLARFDAAYLDIYPYLPGYIRPDLTGLRTLEVGLGYGTLGQMLAERGADYSGLDIADGPVDMMRHRLGLMGVDNPSERVSRGSVLELPFEDGSFDYAVSVGCLHHTGNVRRAVEEVHRVLIPGGRALVMLYNARSFRRASLSVKKLVGRGPTEERERRRYDASESGEAAPATEFLTVREVKAIFADFASLKISKENFDGYALLWKHVSLPRAWFLGNVAKVAGLDLYIQVRK